MLLMMNRNISMERLGKGNSRTQCPFEESGVPDIDAEICVAGANGDFTSSSNLGVWRDGGGERPVVGAKDVHSGTDTPRIG